MIKVFTVNENGKIEFTKAELEKLLNEVYAEGQRNCNCNNSLTWTSPYATPYYSTTRATNSDKDNTSVTEMSKHIDKIIEKSISTNDVYSNLAKELNF